MNSKWVFRLMGLAGVILFVLALTHQIPMDMSSAWMLGIGGAILLVFTVSME